MKLSDGIAMKALEALANGAWSQLALTLGEVRAAQLSNDAALVCDAKWNGRAARVSVFLHEPDEEVLLRLAEQEQRLQALDHAGLVRVLALREVEGRVVLVSEGGSLPPAPAWTSSPSEKDWKALAARAASVAEALSFLHEADVLHRALNPLAIALMDASPLLQGFGIAQPPRVPSFHRPDLDPPFFPAFASPEQARGEAGGIETDVFSLGSVLFYWVTGKPPQGVGARDMVLERIRTQASPRLATQVPENMGAPPEAFARIVDTALAYRSGVRYPNMKIMAEDLRSFAMGGEVVARGPQGGLVEHFQTKQKTWVAVGGFLLACAILYFITKDRALAKPVFPELMDERMAIAWLSGDEPAIESSLAELRNHYGDEDPVVTALSAAGDSSLSRGAWQLKSGDALGALGALRKATLQLPQRRLPLILEAGAAFVGDQPRTQLKDGARPLPSTKSKTVRAIRCWARWRSGDSVTAQPELKRIAGATGFSPWPAFLSAWCLLEDGFIDQSIDAAKGLDLRKPSHLDRMHQLIELADMKTGDTNLKLLDHVMQRRPYDMEVRHRFARALIQSAQWDRARAVLDETLKLRPEDSVSLKLRKSLPLEPSR